MGVIVSGPRTREWLPLTPAQRGLFFAHQLDPDNPCYTTAEVVELSGRLDPERLSAAISRAYGEFEQLRVELALHADGPVQRVREARAVELPLVEFSSPESAEAWLAGELARPLDLLGGELTRTALLRLPDGDWWWHAAHHVVLDGYGVQQLFRRIAALYAEPGLPGSGLPGLQALSDGQGMPGQAARMERLARSGQVVGLRHPEAAPTPYVSLADVRDPEDPGAEEFWEQRLATMSGPASLAGHSAAPSPAALRRARELDGALQRALVHGARRLGVPWPDLVVAASGAYLARMTSAPSIRIGLPLMNRTRPGIGALPAAHTVCTAMNVLPATIPIDGTVAEMLAATAAEQAALREHPWLRQEELARRLGSAGQLFGAQVNLIPFDLELTFGAPSGSSSAQSDTAVTGLVRNFSAGPVEDLTIGLRGMPGRGRVVRLELDANPALYPADELDGHLERLGAWLATVAAADPQTLVRDLPLLTEPERRLVVERLNDTAHPRESATLGRRFADAVIRWPGLPALRFEGETRTYAELDRRARRIAAGLASAGVVAGDVVGVRLPRGFALYETVHALILLGAVYLPMDPELPEERIAMMLDDADASLVIDDPDRWSGEELFAGVHDDADSAAYLLFTSGSTGRPKGVLVGHRAIDNRLAWMQHHLPLEPGDVVLHKTPISFDVSIWELFWPLQVGGCVEIAPPGAHRDPRLLAELLDGVSVVHFVPSMLRAFLSDRLARERVGAVRHVVTSGEALTPDLVEGCAHWLGSAPVNLYGPTEAAVDVTVWDTRVGEATVPIGRPVWNTTCFVLDPQRRPVPVGAVGELWLGGVQLAEGYVGRADLTAERFVPTEFGRLYRTGDLAAWRPDGALRYLGRTDDQVKVRGQRIELGEIESVVAGIAGIAAAVAGVVDGRLVCWVVGDLSTEGPEVLQSAVADRLPAAWVPSRWIFVPEIPLGTSGKADRRRLAAIAPPVAHAGRAPETLVEQRLCDLIGDVVGVRPVPADADFFDLGGDSLKVLHLLAAVEESLGAELSLADVFSHPTAAGLAVLLESGERLDGFAEVLTLRRGAPGRAPLFLLPPAGGLGWCYTGLLRHLPSEVGVHTIQAPGLEHGSPEPAGSLTALAQRQLAAIRGVVGVGDFHVAGWSLGGMAAHAVATLARAGGQRVGSVVLLDAYPPEQWASLPEPSETDALLGLLRLGAATVPDGTALTRQVVAEALRESGSALASLPEKVIDGCVASVLEASRLVRTPLAGVLPGEVTLVVATAPRPEEWLDPAGWQTAVKGTVRRVDVAATHGELVGRADVGAVIAAALEA